MSTNKQQTQSIQDVRPAQQVRKAAYGISLIDLIIRDVAEIKRDPLPDQHPDEMRVTADELRNILEARFEEVDRVEREQMDHEQYQSTVSA